MTEKSDTIRALRTLEYIGDRDHIETDLASRSVKGTSAYPKKGYIINEAIIGEFSELVPSLESKKEKAIDFIAKLIINDAIYIDKNSNQMYFTNEGLIDFSNDLIDHLGY